jgi:hypothetical protein
MAQQEEWTTFCHETEYHVYDCELRDCLVGRGYFRAGDVVVWLGVE